MVLLRIARFLEKVIKDVRHRHSSTLSGLSPSPLSSVQPLTSVDRDGEFYIVSLNQAWRMEWFKAVLDACLF